MQQNIKPYIREQFEPAFTTTELYAKITQRYNNTTFDKYFNPINSQRIRYPVTDKFWNFNQTTRDKFAKNGFFDAGTFYYLNYLTQDNPEVIYDIGCGANLFKQFVPQIVGLSGEDPSSEFYHGDQPGFVDADYISKHQGYFNHAFSFVALHFVPLESLRQRVLDITSMMAPGGKLVLTFNTNRMLDRSSQEFIDRMSNESVMETYIRTELANVPFEYLVFDLDLSMEAQVSFGLGTLRMVIQIPK